MARFAAILVLLMPLPCAEADVIFDFTAICQTGDCDPGSAITGELRFTDDAPLTHRDRLVTVDDFISLVLDFVTVQRAQVRATWSPTTEDTLVLPVEVAIDDAGFLKGLLLHDELKNLFRVDGSSDWEYRQLKIADDGTTEIDFTLAGIGGAFGPRRSSVPEPAMTLFFGLGLAVLVVRFSERARTLRLEGWLGRGRGRQGDDTAQDKGRKSALGSWKASGLSQGIGQSLLDMPRLDTARPHDPVPSELSPSRRA